MAPAPHGPVGDIDDVALEETAGGLGLVHHRCRISGFRCGRSMATSTRLDGGLHFFDREAGVAVCA